MGIYISQIDRQKMKLALITGILLAFYAADVLSIASHQKLPGLVHGVSATARLDGKREDVTKTEVIVAAAEPHKSILDKIPDGVKDGLASGLAAAVVKVILQPLDTIKTVQQAQKLGLDPITAIRKVVERSGVGGLWAGVTVTVLGSSPSVAVYFGAYSSCKKYLTSVMPDNLYLVAVALAASIGNTFASFFRVPYEVIKQRMQNGEHSSTMEAIWHSLKYEGPLGLFTGGKLYSQILRDVPYAIVTLVSYEILQKLAARHREESMRAEKVKSGVVKPRGNKATNALCGALAGGLGSFLTTPMDVVKTRMMTDSSGSPGGGSGYNSITECINRISKEEGVGSFFIGTGPRLLHKVPANGLFFLCYEGFRNLLQVKVKA